LFSSDKVAVPGTKNSAQPESMRAGFLGCRPHYSGDLSNSRENGVSVRQPNMVRT
jgi:hypothetical protein